jgi:uncharacterized repeat protein (TIGR02543 family)
MKKSTVCAALCLVVAMAVSLIPLPVYAAEPTLYEVKDSDTITTINEALENTAYSGIVFPEKMEKTYDGTLLLKTRPLTVQVSAGSTITLAPTGSGARGIVLSDGADVTFGGTGTLIIDGASGRGLQCTTGTDVTIQPDAKVAIRNTKGFGIANEGASGVFTSYGNLTIENCGTPGEGGFIWDNGSIRFLGGTTQILNSDSVNYVSFYAQKDAAIQVENSTLKIAAKNYHSAMTLLTSMTIGAGGRVDLSMANTTEQRGINGAGSLTIQSGGILTINGDGKAKTSYGLRGINTVVNGGEVNIAGVNIGITARETFGSLTVNGDSKVTIDAPVQCGKLTTAPVIDGGSVMLSGSAAITKGIKADTTDQLSGQKPVNSHRTPLSLFLISNFANNQFKTDDLTYSVRENHDGTAYVWAPEVEVRFYDTNSDEAGHQIGSSLYGISGQSLKFVNGAAPADPTNPDDSTQVFAGWYLDTDYSKPWTVDSALTTIPDETVIKVYAKYKDPSYLVTYDSQGGSAVAGDSDGWNVAVNGQKLYKPAAPVKEGYTFGGWYTEAKCTNAFDHAKVLEGVSADFTLYAKWTKNATEIIPDYQPQLQGPVKAKTPQTGDSTQPEIWLGLMALCTTAAISLTAIGQKKKTGEE